MSTVEHLTVYCACVHFSFSGSFGDLLLGKDADHACRLGKSQFRAEFAVGQAVNLTHVAAQMWRPPTRVKLLQRVKS